jgi:hypothetical protein
MRGRIYYLLVSQCNLNSNFYLRSVLDRIRFPDKEEIQGKMRLRKKLIHVRFHPGLKPKISGFNMTASATT